MLHNHDTSMRCPCGSGRPFRFCCEPAIEGQKPAATAEALMRSRYTAFAMGFVDYLLDTTAAEKISPDDAAIIAEQVKYTNWLGLEIIRTNKGRQGDRVGTVEFRATFEADNQRGVLHETSNFRQENGCWLYVDGAVEVQSIPV